ncbi:hypothetical protein J6590_084975 [Homalodisca vitripennis]|nr:hypothetical protein J6590_084975 [Homalodisca vitripennis]
MDFMSREGKEGTFVIDPKKVRERVATAVGVSRRTLTRISAEKRKLAETTTSFETPNKKMEEKFIGVQSQLEDTIESFVIDLGAESSEEDNSDFSEDDIEYGNLSGVEKLI